MKVSDMTMRELLDEVSKRFDEYVMLSDGDDDGAPAWRTVVEVHISALEGLETVVREWVER